MEVRGAAGVVKGEVDMEEEATTRVRAVGRSHDTGFPMEEPISIFFFFFFFFFFMPTNGAYLT